MADDPPRGPVVAVLGTFDTKGDELAFVAERLRAEGCEVLRIDLSTGAARAGVSDISADQVLAVLGEPVQATLDRRDRGECIALMARAAEKFVRGLQAEGHIDAIIALGGGGGTALAAAAMRTLPLGFPKLVVSTLASGNTAPYVENSDLVLMPAVVDVAGINRISRVIFENASAAIAGMARAACGRKGGSAVDRPLVVASMFGNTTTCVNEARRLIEEAGFEVLVFHATGTGGRAMESLIASGMVSGVLDITTTEWADELVGGILSAGATRLDAAAAAGVPAIVVPGCLDMVNFGERASVPARFASRRFYQHNPQVTLMRTTPEECAELGRILAEKVNRYTARVTVLLPRGGISVISAPGQPFHDPAADEALFTAIRRHLRPDIQVVDTPEGINDPAFARRCAEALLGNLKNQ